MEVLIISTGIGSLHGTADGILVGAKSNAWDGSSTPKTGWDAMLDSCEGTKSASEYHFEKGMNCLPKQLMVSFYGASFPVVVVWVAPWTTLCFKD